MACIDMKRKAITQKVPTKADLQQEVNVMKKLNEALEDVLKKDKAISTLKESRGEKPTENKRFREQTKPNQR